MPVQYSIGDIVQTRKQHPCGNDKMGDNPGGG